MAQDPIPLVPGRRRILASLARLTVFDKLAQFLTRVLPPSWRPHALIERWKRLPPVTFVRAWWLQQRRFTRHLLSNLTVGLLISVPLLILPEGPWLGEVEDTAIDWVMQMQWGSAPTRDARPFVMLDIDEATYRAWGEPFHIPRDRLLKLIDYAVRGKAALIVVDVDLSRRGEDRAADEHLQAYLAQHAVQGGTPILLARTFRNPLPEETGYPAERRSFLEDDPRIAHSPLIQWGSTMFALDQDGMLRRWHLWQPACAEGRPVMVPSLQLLAVAFLRQPTQAAAEVHNALEPLAPKHCDRESVSRSNAQSVTITCLALSAEPHLLAQRIIYHLPWRPERGQSYPEIPWRSTAVSLLGLPRSAKLITDSDRPIAPQDLDGRVVMIGGSFADSRDVYMTPLGEMPGALVLVNAISSLHQYGEIGLPPWYARLLVEAGLIVVMSLAFAWAGSFWGMLVSGMTIIILLIPLSFLFIKAGIWLDFAIPLVAVQWHRMADEVKELRKHLVPSSRED